MGEKAKDAKSHREPEWPVNGFAPGFYMGICATCGETFFNMDKRAVSCFPCAIEGIATSNAALRQENARLRTLMHMPTEFEQLRAALDEFNEAWSKQQ